MVGKGPENSAAGDDLRSAVITAFVAEGATVMLLPRAVVALGQVFNCALSDLPHDRARFATARNHRALGQAARRHRVAVVSTEPFDELLLHVGLPAIPILHNMTSLRCHRWCRTILWGPSRLGEHGVGKNSLPLGALRCRRRSIAARRGLFAWPRRGHYHPVHAAGHAAPGAAGARRKVEAGVVALRQLRLVSETPRRHRFRARLCGGR